jgi:hypothetical protein
MKKLIPLHLLLLLFALVSCEEELSERDQKLQQQQSELGIKKQELKVVEGFYQGAFTSFEGGEQKAEIKLQVKDVPDTTSGAIDPPLIPQLVGNVRLILGSVSLGEYIDLPIKKAEFKAGSKNLYFVVFHETTQELTFNLHLEDDRLWGTWDAPEVGTSGSIDTLKTEQELLHAETN